MSTAWFLLYSVTFVPISGAYERPITVARDAALIQSGIREEWVRVRTAAEKRVPPRLAYIGVAYKIVHEKKVVIKTQGHVFTVRKDGAEAALRWEW